MIKRYSGILFICSMVIFSGCKVQRDPEINVEEISESEFSSGSGRVRMIFYNMNLPSEMTRIFEKVGVNFSPEFLNASDNFSLYDTPDKLALNIGIYGVDLGYCRIFNQNVFTAKYFSAIQIMYEKLGIPDLFFQDVVDGLEKYYNDKDSLARFASVVYERADNYLRESNNESGAALVIAGGWIESVYLGCKISEKNPDNIDLRERIAGQKYSLNSLISLLSNYQDNIAIAEYILMLKSLKVSFDKVNIYYQQENFDLDTINKKISSTNYTINLSPEVFREIVKTISEIRMEITK